MTDRFYLGIDGGQTSTLAVIIDGAGRLLGVGRGGPSNHVHEPGGMERLRQALHGSLSAAWNDTGLPREPGRLPELEAVCCGMTGGGEYVPELLQETEYIIRHLRVENDTVTAHAGALLGKPGVVVIAGTGSAAYGMNAQGQTAHAGGWAYLMGDEGSAYDIGRQALVAAARMYDGRGPDTCLLDELLAHFGKAAFMEVRALVYSEQFERADVAALAPLVARSAGQGDRAAQDILDGAGENLAEVAGVVLRKLGMDRQPAQVSTMGGVFRAGNLILRPFELALKRLSPQAALTPPALPPVLGAALLALKMGGIRIDKTIQQNLLETAGRMWGK